VIDRSTRRSNEDHPMPHRRNALLTSVLAGSLLLTACGGGGEDPAAAEPVPGTEVSVVDNDFEPVHLEVASGGTVTWRWEGDAAHDVVGEGFESEIQDEGTFSHSFGDPGTYDYECTLHNGMTGRVTVVES
jgi:plastocyanin